MRYLEVEGGCRILKGRGREVAFCEGGGRVPPFAVAGYVCLSVLEHAAYELFEHSFPGC